uniref:Uncharacterized protein n=1 Tax=Oryza brachyantha TaxID=4533 RepID=J3LDG3_ORYBR
MKGVAFFEREEVAGLVGRWQHVDANEGGRSRKLQRSGLKFKNDMRMRLCAHFTRVPCASWLVHWGRN